MSAIRCGSVLAVAAALWAAAAGAALVEQHGVEALGIEQPAVVGLAAAAGAAMQIDRRQCRRRGRRFRHRSRGRRRRRAAPRSAAQTDRIAFDGFAGVGVRRHGRLPSPACRRRNCDRGNGPGAAAASRSACLKICSCIGDSVQAGSVLPASPVSAKAWQRQPPKSTSLNSQLLHGSGIQPVPR